MEPDGEPNSILQVQKIKTKNLGPGALNDFNLPIRNQQITFAG